MKYNVANSRLAHSRFSNNTPKGEIREISAIYQPGISPFVAGSVVNILPPTRDAIGLQTSFLAAIVFGSFQCSPKGFNGAVQLGIVPTQSLGRLDRVKHGRVIPSTKKTAYFLQTVFRQFPRQIHADLAGPGDRHGSFLSLQVGESNMEMVGKHIQIGR